MRNLKISRIDRHYFKGGSASGGSGKGKGGGGGGASETEAKTTTHDPLGIEGKNPSEQAAILSSELGIPLKRAEAIVSAVSSFTADDYTKIRKSEMGGTTGGKVGAINEFLAKAPAFQGEIHRGFAFKTEAEAKGLLSALRGKGGGLELNAMSSFSSKKSIAAEFAEGKQQGFYARVGVTVSVKNKSGRSIRSLSKVKGEDEVLVGKGVRYRTVKQTTSYVGGRTVHNFELEEF